MTKLNLSLGNSMEVDLDYVHAVSTPQPTRTWHPVPHGVLLNHVRTHLELGGMKVVEEAHGISADNARYFGMLQIAPDPSPMQKLFGLGWPDGRIDDDDFGLIVGLRNSHDQAFAAGLALGAGVFVCDNLCFDGTITVARKHTRHIMRDLERLTANAVSQLVGRQHDLAARYDKYRHTEISDAQAHDLLIRCLQARALTATKIPGALQEWQAPRHPEFRSGKTVWRLFNAVTQQYHGNNPGVVMRRSPQLQGVMDQACSLVS